MKKIRSDRRLPLPKWPFAKKKLEEEGDENVKPASFRSMMRYATKNDYILLFIGVLCSVANGAIGSAILMLYARIVDAIVRGQTQYDAGDLDSADFKAELLTCSSYYFVAVGLILLLGFPSVACLHIACERQIKRIRQKFLQQVLNQDIAWLDRNEVGRLTQKMNTGVQRMQSGTGKTLALIIYAVSGCATGVILCFAINWKVSIVMLAFLPCLFVSIYGSGKAVKTILRKEAKFYGAASAVAEEVLSGIRTVMSFNAQPFELDRYGSHVKGGYKSGVQKVYWTAGFAAMYNFFIFGAMGVLFWYGSTLSLESESGVTVGIVQGIFWLFALGAIRLGQAAPHVSSLTSARSACAELLSVIDRVPDLDCASMSGEKPSKVEGTIVFSDIHFRYPARPELKILKGVSFTVQKTETVALVGHSGCGKSTLFSLLLRFYDPEKGRITIDGQPLDSLNIEWLRRTIGVVSQESVVFSGTVAENLRLGREDLSQKEMEDVCKQSNADEFIRKLPNGYETRIGEGGIRLSGGQQQRLAIARVLARNPRILLLDEPTSALDTRSEGIVQAAIEKASAGRTTLIIAHRLSTVRNADRIVCFSAGQIIESGSHEELMEAKGNYYKLVVAQELEKAAQMEDVVLAEEDDSISARIEEISKQGSLMSRSGIRRTLEHHSMHSARSSLSAIHFELEPEAKEVDNPQSKVEAASVWAILRLAAPEKHLVIIGFLLTVLRGFAWPTYTLLLGRLYRDMSHLEDFGRDYLAHQNLTTGLLFGALAVVSSLLTLASGMMLGTTGERITRRLRMGIFKNFLSQDASFFDRPEGAVGCLTARLSVDAPAVQAAIDQRLADVMQASTSFVIGIVAGLLLDYRVAAVAIIAVSIMLTVQLLILNTLKRRTIANARNEEEAAIVRLTFFFLLFISFVSDGLICNRACAECSGSHPTKDPLRSVLFDYGSSVPPDNSNGIVAFDLFCPLVLCRRMEFCGHVSVDFVFVPYFRSVIYGVAAFLITSGQVEPILAFQCVSVINAGIIMTFLPAASYIPEFIRAKVAAGVLLKLLDEPTKIDGTSDNGKKIDFHGDVSIKHAYFSYPNHKQLVLKDFSINAYRGQTLALVGPSGSGKSTTIQLLERFYDVLSGSVKIDNVDIREISVRHLRSQMALVEQQPTLFNLSIAENIAYGMKGATPEQIIEAAKLANIHEFISSLPRKYDTPVGARGGQLSGGQRQRICIARAVVRNPKILLLDEATSALDSESERIVQEALEKAQVGRTCITIAHRLSTIQHADIIAVVKDGKVLEKGNHQQLLARKGLYYRLANRRQQ